jgi:hypothetical protein
MLTSELSTFFRLEVSFDRMRLLFTSILLYPPPGFTASLSMPIRRLISARYVIDYRLDSAMRQPARKNPSYMFTLLRIR